jgi:hypothetical protein
MPQSKVNINRLPITHRSIGYPFLASLGQATMHSHEAATAQAIGRVLNQGGRSGERSRSKNAVPKNGGFDSEIPIDS